MTIEIVKYKNQPQFQFCHCYDFARTCYITGLFPYRSYFGNKKVFSVDWERRWVLWLLPDTENFFLFREFQERKILSKSPLRISKVDSLYKKKCECIALVYEEYILNQVGIFIVKVLVTFKSSRHYLCLSIENNDIISA